MRRNGLENKEKKTLFLRPIFFVALGAFVLALTVHIIAANSVAFADLVAKWISPPLRKLLGYLSALVPFSLAEMLLVSSPVWVTLLLSLAHRIARDRKRSSRMLSILLSIPLFMYSLFVFTLGVGYYTTPLAQRLDFANTEPSRDSLYEVAVLLSERADAAAKEAGVLVSERGSNMPISHRDMNLSLIRAYETLDARYDFISHFGVGTKPVLFSHLMAYTHITGVYSFFTGEMNVCTAYPDFSTVFTAAHEMAHARGIAREDEANFVAFLACESSEDPYIRYGGYMNLLQYVSNALYETDPALYKQAWAHYSDTVRTELLAYNEVLRGYSGSVASQIAGAWNDAYLQGMGTGGSISYDLVVHLAVGYFAR